MSERLYPITTYTPEGLPTRRYMTYQQIKNLWADVEEMTPVEDADSSSTDSNRVGPNNLHEQGREIELS